MTHSAITRDQHDAFHRDGYLRIPALFARKEIEPLQRFVTDPEDGARQFYNVGPLDYIGWTQPADVLIGVLCRSQRVVGTANALLGEPCYHYHSKIVRKPAHRETTLDWHQDFGSWYKDGCLLPNLLTAVVAVTPATGANGALRLLTGSHHLGRLDRLPDGHDSYTHFSLQPQRLQAISDRFPVDTIEMAVGDAMFFDCNTLHASGPNRSDETRILLEMSYNASSNEPIFENQEHHRYRDLDIYSDKGPIHPGQYDTVAGKTRLVNIDDPDDPGIGVFRRRFDIGLC